MYFDLRVITLAGFIIIIFLLLSVKMLTRRKRPMVRTIDASLTCEELEEHAKKLAIDHVVARKTILPKKGILSDWPIPRMNDNFSFIASVYKELSDEVNGKRAVPPAAEWLLDNFYIIEEQVKSIRQDFKKEDYLRLPVLKCGPMKSLARIYVIATELVAHTEGQIDERIITDFLKAYQSNSILLDRELWAMPVMIRLALIDNIRNICEKIRDTHIKWRKADEIADSILKSESPDENYFKKILRENLLFGHDISLSFVEHLSYRIRRGGRQFSPLLRHIDAALARHGTSLDAVTQREHNTQAAYAVLIGNCIVSLKFISTMDWVEVFEASSQVSRILSQDPDGTYKLMDLPSRDYYRKKIEQLASEYKISEIHIAQRAVELAAEAMSRYRNRDPENPDELDVKCHVGYYIAGNGVPELIKSLGHSAKKMEGKAQRKKTLSAVLYFLSIGLLTFVIAICLAFFAYISARAYNTALALLAGIFSLLPASEIAIFVVNRTVCKLVKPYTFPRLELKDGIPKKYSTMIVIPALLPDEKRVKELIQNLETHYHANREDNLYFALAGDFKDSNEEKMPGDDAIIQAALEGIRELNNKYSRNGVDIFYYFHRHRQYNPAQNKWMGWERKRGALIELNDLLLGSMDTSYSIISGSLPPDVEIKYVITLDADTMMPIGSAKKLIGTLAHPLNRPVVNPHKNIVVEGYGLIQPRIIFDIESSNKTLFSRIYTGQEGFDPYAGAVSDIYQDLFGEGIFTGKGIYHLEVFQNILKETIPDNAVLSHDLIEGCFIRAGLATDIELVDSYPKNYDSFCARLHRWVRGDWQLIPWLGKNVRDKSGNWIKNPISAISKWKILDNMRRSLIAPALFLQLALGLTILPGILPWVLFPLVVLGLPFIGSVIGYLMSKPFTPYRIKQYQPVISGIKAAFLQALLSFIFLPHQAYLMVHAVTITLIRVLFSKRDMLEWVTAADVEKRQKNSLESYYAKMKSSPILAAVLLLLILLFRPEASGIGVFLVLLWSAGPYIAYSSGKVTAEDNIQLPQEDMLELRRISRKTWRYFEEFMNHKNNFLPPDNYQEEPPNGIAHRTSPTNIGLGFLSVLSARDFGYICTTEMVDLASNTISTIEKMEKWNGHLYNWYDTHTLRPLRPRYVSTVDSGNLVCYLITFMQGLKEYMEKPLFDEKYIAGLKDTIRLIGEDEENTFVSQHLKLLEMNGDEPVLLWWSKCLDELSKRLIEDYPKKSAWKSKSLHAISMLKRELSEFAPWLEKTGDLSHTLKDTDLSALYSVAARNPRLIDLPDIYRELLDSTENVPELRKVLEKSIDNVQKFIERCRNLIDRIRQILDATSFKPLYVEKKHLFSIGYNIEENRLTNSYYDLLASEARQTSYIAIARGEVPPTHWFKLGRAITVVDNYKGLISWTGTMFEYLMPLIIMRSFKNTLLDESYSFAVRSQKKYGRQRRIPWGASESGFYSMDINLDYQYKAIGVPWLGLKRGLIEDIVAAPYATFLALHVDPAGAMENIKRLKAEGLDGAYGYYEAVDYTPERVPFGEKRAIVRSFMAHHQGMSLLSLNNYINDNIMQKRFHSDPAVKAAELLLQEKVPTNLVLTKETKEKVVPFKAVAYKGKGYVRRFRYPDLVLPRVHMLSNGFYTVMITDRGTGYSKSRDISVTRWREDVSMDYYGIFFYLRDVDSGRIWSATHAPLDVAPDKFEGYFTADKARFKRIDGDIETSIEITVDPGDNVEIRRLLLKNNSNCDKTIEVTSYYEPVLSHQAADVAHPVFNKLFIRTEYLEEYKSLVAVRRPRFASEKEIWAFNTPVIEGGEIIGDMEYETDRMQFIGRGNTVSNPGVIINNKPLSNTVGPVLDPIMSTRFRIRIKSGHSIRLSYIIGTADSRELMIDAIEKYSAPESVENAFRLALTRSQVEAKYLNINAAEADAFQDMLSHIHFISPLRKQKSEFISKNTKGQSALWTYGISGDLPIVLVVVKSTDETDIVYEVLKAHEFWLVKGLKVDLVILNEEENSYNHPLFSLLKDAVASSHAHNLINKPGGVYILNRNNVADEDLPLFYSVARIILRGDGGSLAEQIKTTYRKQAVEAKQSAVADKSAGQEAHMPEYSDRILDKRKLKFFNELGGFSPDGSEYIIRLEKGQNTPAPWVNIISNPNFGTIVSEAGSVYTWCENSRENKLTPWSNDPVSNPPGEVLYLTDWKAGRTWTITPLPVRDEGTYVITHGFGYSVYKHVSNGMEQTLIQFVPIDDNVKISLVKLKNLTNESMNIVLTYYIRPVLGVSDQNTAMHIKTSIGEGNVLLIENPYNDEFPGRIAFLETSEKERWVTGDRKDFIGSGSISSPEGLRQKRLPGSVGIGYDPCAAIQTEVVLKPDEEKEVVFLLGMGKNSNEVYSLISKYRNVENARRALISTKSFWKDRLGKINVQTPDKAFNIMLNGWLMYQVIACRLWARTAFYQSGGAYGFRDQLQDSLATLHIWPELARNQILLHAAHQFVEGDVQHWWHEQENKGTRTRFSDDRLWLPYVTAEYIDVTGDTSILDIEVPFLEDEPLHDHEDERYNKPRISAQSATVYEHCVRAIDISLKFGEHGLPLMGSGDWNDGMNTVGNKGKGESVWLGWFLYSTMEKFIPLCIQRNDNERAQRYLESLGRLKQALEENAWDGNWYRRAYFDNGTPLGSIQNSECKIDSVSQSWAVISGAGDAKRIKAAMQSVENYLVNKEEGLVKLLTPPFDNSELEPGYIKSYVPGVRENGGQYTHAAAWVIIAFAKMCNGDTAWEIFDLINPINHTRTPMENVKYKVEPYVIPADVYAVPPHVGRGGWTWYTGSAAWIYKAGLEYILGIRRKGQSLEINPCIPKKWSEFTVNYKYMNTIYRIKVANPKGVSCGVKSIVVDGSPVVVDSKPPMVVGKPVVASGKTHVADGGTLILYDKQDDNPAAFDNKAAENFAADINQNILDDINKANQAENPRILLVDDRRMHYIEVTLG